MISTGETVFEMKNLSYVYTGNISALTDISFSIHAGERVAILGANGTGKSTILKILDGLIFGSHGEVLVFGKPLSEKALKDASFARDFRQRVGLVFQDADVQLFSPTVWDDITFGPLQLGCSREEVVSRASEAMSLLNIEHLKDRPPYRLSGGEKKKVSLASVISIRPQVLLLDEPTVGLDPHSQGNLIDFLMGWRDGGRTLIFSTQDLDIVEVIADRVIVLGEAHRIVADGHPKEFLSQPDFLLQTNLIHEHTHRHKDLVHRHYHIHDHHH